jgi:hypothetical protein
MGLIENVSLSTIAAVQRGLFGLPFAGVSISDTYTRGDNAASLGATETGQLYSLPNGGTFGISGNQAYNPSAQADKMAVVQSGAADCTVGITIAVLGAASGAGIYFRVVDANNWWRFVFDGSNYTLRKVVAGAGADTDVVGGTLAGSDMLYAVLQGSTITVKKNTTTIFTRVDAALNTATMHGFGTGGVGSAATRFDNLTIS